MQRYQICTAVKFGKEFKEIDTIKANNARKAAQKFLHGRGLVKPKKRRNYYILRNGTLKLKIKA